MLSQDVPILSFVLPVPGQSPAKLREKWEGAGDLQQQQLGPSSSALTLLGPGKQQHQGKVMCEAVRLSLGCLQGEAALEEPVHSSGWPNCRRLRGCGRQVAWKAEQALGSSSPL